MIVVIEAVAKNLEQGIKPRQAALECMGELIGAIIASSLVLMAVFVPVAFYPGGIGIIYRQFALTIAFSIAISTFNALTFSPMMAGPRHHRRERCLLYTSPSPRDATLSRMPSSA